MLWSVSPALGGYPAVTTEADVDSAVQVVVADDATSAELIILPDAPSDQATVEACCQVLQAAGVELHDDVRGAVEKLQAHNPSGQRRAVVARAQPPQPGQDGRVEWTVSDDPAAVGEDEGDPTTANSFSHYERSAFVMVEAGQVIGRVIEPKPSTQGRDVLGRPIPLDGSPGQPVNLQIDPSIQLDAAGRLVAQITGVLERQGDIATIRHVMCVDGSVDFSTGNIRFNGDVLVRGGICDCFVVKATGQIEVGGLIEAATLESGGDLVARGGFAGRERGTAHIGGDLVARYLDNVHGHVGRDLIVEREVINCDLVVHNGVRIHRGSIIGGRLVIAGAVEAATLGSAAAVETQLIIGYVPVLQAKAAQLHRAIATLRCQRDELGQTSDDLTGEALDRWNELNCQIEQFEQVQSRLHEQIRQKRIVDLTVTRTLHLGVIIQVAGRRFQIGNDVPGPVHIHLDEAGQPVYSAGGDVDQPLEKLT